MTLYRDMTNEELAQTGKDFTVRDVPGARKLLWAMASRLEEVSKSLAVSQERLELVREQRDEALRNEEPEPTPPPKPKRPDSLADLMLQRGLSKEARQWLRKYRPETTEMLRRARAHQAYKGACPPAAVGAQDMAERLHQSRLAQRAAMQNTGLGGLAGAACGAMGQTSLSNQLWNQ